MSKMVIIPDVHEDSENLALILEQAAPYDQAIFLGDWFDRFSTQRGSLVATLRWLQDNLDDPKNTFLFGNHDVPYAFPTIFDYQCSGHQHAQRGAIREVIGDFGKFKLFTEVDGWTISHAGFHPSTAKGRAEDCAAALSDARVAKSHRMLRAGVFRGGGERVGGVTWLDWNNEFKPVPRMRQIVGHTVGTTPRWKDKNACIDTRLRHFAVIEDGELMIQETKGWLA